MFLSSKLCLDFQTLPDSLEFKRTTREASQVAEVSFFLFLPHHESCGISVPWPRIEPMLPAVKAWSLNHWTTREFPRGVIDPFHKAGPYQVRLKLTKSKSHWVKGAHPPVNEKQLSTYVKSFWLIDMGVGFILHSQELQRGGAWKAMSNLPFIKHLESRKC